MTRRLGLIWLLPLAGCTVGPNYRPQAPDVPPHFAEAQPPQSAAETDLSEWWKAFGDPELDRLVSIALADSLDIKTATSRVRQARAGLRAARAEALPEIGAAANATHIHFSKNAGLSSLSSLFGGGGSSGGGNGGGSGGGNQGGIALPGDGVTTYSLGFDASWEIDLFGGVRRAVEGADAREEAAVWNARDAAVSLAAEIADDYLQLRLAQQREAIAHAEIARQTRTLKIMAETAQVGLVPEGDTARQRAQLASAQASLPPLVAAQRAQMHAVAVLLGRSPEALIAELSTDRGGSIAPPVVPPGLPSDLLRRRPDIRAAERNLAATTADIGVAVAQLYPRFSLTGMAQLISTALGNLFSADSLQLTGTAGLNFPILDFGRRHAQIDERREAAAQAYFAYQQTVLGALRDVEDALVRVDTERQRNAALRSGLTDAQRAVDAVYARYSTGLSGLDAVLDAQATVLADRDQLAQSDGALRRNLISLYKALGGGWDSDAAARALLK